MEDLPCNSKLSVDLSKFRLTKEEVDARLGEGGADDEDPMEDDDEYEEAGGAEDKGVTERGEQLHFYRTRG